MRENNFGTGWERDESQESLNNYKASASSDNPLSDGMAKNDHRVFNGPAEDDEDA